MSQPYTIRPAGRHLLTIGEDLIKDPYAAIVELVKNGYDADSEKVLITFRGGDETLQIVVEDFGHGMTKKVVTEKWLVPSTADKLERRVSPRGRILQGRKGIGRYSASVLGGDLLLETTVDGATTTVFLDWARFREAEFLGDVEILVEESSSQRKNGTKLIIGAADEYKSAWTSETIAVLKSELMKLISPLDYKEGEFEIQIDVDNFPEEGDVSSEVMRPYPLLDLYDYQIRGEISEVGKGRLVYSCQKLGNVADQEIDFQLDSMTQCGALNFDFRVYDREPDAIQSLIDRGLKHGDGTPLQRNETKLLLNQYNGIGVYRNGFRIRPLGDPGFDWLKLSADRVQNPSLRVGENQVIGFLEIQSEEESNLIEKSARDGLRENRSYQRLFEIAKAVLGELESRRFTFREKTGVGRNLLKVEQQLTSLLSFDELKKSVGRQLNQAGVSENVQQDVLTLIEKEANEKDKILMGVSKTIAIYQEQATLGKIMTVLLHEGRHPLSYFKNQVPNFKHWINKVSGDEVQEKVNRICEGYIANTNVLLDLFKKVDPLASGRRANRSWFRLNDVIFQVLDVFSSVIKEAGIDVVYDDSVDVSCFGWEQDYYIIITNVIDNSIYWMDVKGVLDRKISLLVEVDQGEFETLTISDSGPGISEELIESQMIFEPNFTTKGQGSGLGLAIAGEAATRNSLKLIAEHSDEGAVFRVEMKK